MDKKMKHSKAKANDELQQYLYNKAHGYIWTPDTLKLICIANDNDPASIGKQVLEITNRADNAYLVFMTSDKRLKYLIRGLHKNETPLLKDFLYEAIFIPKGSEPPAMSIVESPELRVYTDNIGTKKGDHCLVADCGGTLLGAVWSRIMNDYGHIDDETPSLAISLHKEYRRQGIGSQLMVKMLELLKLEGYEQVSLAVQKANYAAKMYADIGFKTVRETSEEYIMVYSFTDDCNRAP